MKKLLKLFVIQYAQTQIKAFQQLAVSNSFVELSLPFIPCCHGPGKGWIMDHALVTLIVINLSGVMTHVSDTVKLWSALSPP